jgi:capsular exopolysaccharide synthesis family protein
MMNEQIEVVAKRQHQVSLREIALKYLHYWWLPALLMILSMTGAYLYLRYTTPKFFANATMMIKDEDAGAATEKFQELLLTKKSVNVTNEVQILKSTSLIQRVIKSLDLQKSYYAKGKIKDANVYKDSRIQLQVVSLAQDVSDFMYKISIKDNSSFLINDTIGPIQFGKQFTLAEGQFIINKSPMFEERARSGDDYIVKYNSLETATAVVASGLKITPIDEYFSSVLILSMISDNPEIAADVLNQLMYEYERANVEDKKRIGDSTLAFIANSLKNLEGQLSNSEKDLQAFRQQNNIINPSAQAELFFNKLKETDKGISEQGVKLKVAQLVEKYVSDQNNAFRLIPSNLGIEDLTLINLVKIYNEAILQRERALLTAKENNPVVITLEHEIEKTRTAILENIGNIKNSYKIFENELRSQNAEISAEINAIPYKEKEVKERQREAEIRQNLYLYFLQKQQETAISQASSLSNSRIIDKAVPIKSAFSPKQPTVYSIALLLGLLLSAVIIYLLEALNDKVSGRQEVERATNVPIVGEIGHSEGSESIVVNDKSRSIISEQFRITRTNLQFVLGNISKPVLLVTSSFSGEGKSFISTNIGSVMALAGKKTVVLEFDLRKPKIISNLSLSKNKGITNFLVGDIDLSDMVIKVPGIENLSVVPCGPIPPNPSELLLSEKLTELIRRLKLEFDFIVIDSAPVGLVSDAIVLAQHADATLYVVRHKYTYKKQLQLIEELYVSKRLPKLSIIMNDIVFKRGSGYYGYGYGYGYGFGSQQSSTSKGWFKGKKN